jgi:aminopeptidase N
MSSLGPATGQSRCVVAPVMRFPPIGILALLIVAALLGAQPVDAQGAPPSVDRVVLPREVIPKHYAIDISTDAVRLSFTGTARIDIEVLRPTRSIVLNAADLTFKRVTLSGRSEVPKVTLDLQEQTATFEFGTPIAPGSYVLSIDYRGRIYLQASGLFALEYDVAGRKRRRALFTQFENSDARRFVPCWDEPDRKATFALTTTLPADQMAVSNMPIQSVEELGAGRKRVRFGETPRMSSYLLFYAAGDFERVHRLVGDVDVGVVVKRGDAERGRFALDTAAQLLPYYNDYFGTPFPLPKLDLVAAPGSSQFFSAMENWGAIFYFERAILTDANLSTQADRQNVAITVAHEMAHQWFGDLVTMAWWDDLWLNEGFASWMEVKATDHFNPQWRLWLQNQTSVDQAMRIDAGKGTHPIVTPVKDVQQANAVFDDITYLKGAAVIRMLEAYVGEDAFRAGVRRYMQDHAYANTITDDLWQEIDSVSPKKITSIAHDFTLRAGVPLISVQEERCDAGRLSLALSQQRFLIDDDATQEGAQSWHVPVALQVLGNASVTNLIVSGSAPNRVTLPGCGPALLNVGQSGYFRSHYEPAYFATLAQHYAELAAEDQLGLLNDALALDYVGRAPLSQFLNLAAQLPTDADPLVWSALTGPLVSVDRLFTDGVSRDAFRVYARALLRKPLSRTGWDARPDEANNLGILRAAVLEAMGRFGDPGVVTQARQRFARFLAAPAALPAAERTIVLGVVAQNADRATWDRLHGLARGATIELERQGYYGLLGESQDADLAKRALELALTEEAPVTLRPFIITAVANNYPELAANFTIAHWNAIAPMLESDSRSQFVPRLATGSSDPNMITVLNSFAAGHFAATDRSTLDMAVAQIRYNAQLRAQLPGSDRWLGMGRSKSGPEPQRGP